MYNKDCAIKKQFNTFSGFIKFNEPCDAKKFAYMLLNIPLLSSVEILRFVTRLANVIKPYSPPLHSQLVPKMGN